MGATLISGSAAFAPNDFDVLAPAFVEGEELPVYAGGKVAEDGFGGGVDVEGGGYEVEAWGLGGEANVGEVAMTLELA